MSNRTEARSAKVARTHATGRLPLLRLFSTPLKTPARREDERYGLCLLKNLEFAVCFSVLLPAWLFASLFLHARFMQLRSAALAYS